MDVNIYHTVINGSNFDQITLILHVLTFFYLRFLSFNFVILVIKNGSESTEGNRTHEIRHQLLSHKTSSLKNMSDRLKRKRNAIISKDKVALDD